MEHYLQPLMDYLRQHPQIGLLITFVIAFIESLPLLGTLFPGSITMTAIGALIGSSVLPATATFIWAIAGAFIGDCFGFWLGNRYHESIRSIWPIYKFTKWLDIGEKFFAKHGGKSIIIGRFIGPTRSAMPLIAGIFRVTWSKFIPVGLIAAVLWSLVYILPGVLLGALALEFPPGKVTKVLLVGLAFIVALWLIFWAIQYFFKQLGRLIGKNIDMVWNWLNRHYPSYTLIRLITNQQKPEDHYQLMLVLLALISSLFFLLLWLNISHDGAFVAINTPLFYLIQSFQSSASTSFWALITLLATPTGMIITSILAAVGFAFFKQWRACVHLLILTFLAATAVEGIKWLYYFPRPTSFLKNALSSSFPSGHTIMGIVVFGFLAFLTSRIVSKKIPFIIAIVIILLISLSRLFLGQHWLTDILGAWLLGLSLLLFIIVSYQRQPKPNSRFTLDKKYLAIILTLSILIPWAVNLLLHWQTTIRNSQASWPQVTLSFRQWWSEPTIGVPLYRSDRFGHLAQPFNIQWAASLEEIQTFLIKNGWEELERYSHVQNTIQRIMKVEPEFHMPILGWLYRNQPPVLFYIKHLKSSQDILELQLWDSGVRFNDSSLPLWVGIITYHSPPETLMRFPKRYIHLQSGQILTQPFTVFKNFQIKIAHIPVEQQPPRIRSLNWDGNIFILKENDL